MFGRFACIVGTEGKLMWKPPPSCKLSEEHREVQGKRAPCQGRTPVRLAGLGLHSQEAQSLAHRLFKFKMPVGLALRLLSPRGLVQEVDRDHSVDDT